MKRKPMLLKRLMDNTGHEAKRTIGLIGTNRGAGVTYTGMLLAYYFGTEKRMKTAYLECNSHMDFDRLWQAYEWSDENEQSFRLDRVTYYKKVAKNQIPEILNEDYDCCILDFGMDFSSSREEFIRCGSKIILGDRAIWNQSRMIAFLRDLKHTKESRHWIHLIPCAEQRLVARMARETDRCFFRIPFEPDVTSLSKETYRLFYHLFG